jgi:hypothetical protein
MNLIRREEPLIVLRGGALSEVGSCHVPNLTFYVPNLTGQPNVPKIEQRLSCGSGNLKRYGTKIPL